MIDRDDAATGRFELIAAHFVEVFLNTMYHNAVRNAQNSRSRSITDAYQNIVISYVDSLKKNKSSYNDTVGYLHKYIIAKGRLTGMVFSQFIDNTVEMLVPPEFYPSLQNLQRDEVFCKAVTDLVSALGVRVIKEDMLRRIIDERAAHAQARETAVLLQDFARNRLFDCRTEFYQKFLGQIAQAKEAPARDPKVPRLMAKIRELVEAKVSAETRLRTSSKALATLHEENQRLAADLASSRSKVVSLESRLRLHEAAREPPAPVPVASSHSEHAASPGAPAPSAGSLESSLTPSLPTDIAAPPRKQPLAALASGGGDAPPTPRADVEIDDETSGQFLSY